MILSDSGDPVSGDLINRLFAVNKARNVYLHGNYRAAPETVLLMTDAVLEFCLDKDIEAKPVFDEIRNGGLVAQAMWYYEPAVQQIVSDVKKQFLEERDANNAVALEAHKETLLLVQELLRQGEQVATRTQLTAIAHELGTLLTSIQATIADLQSKIPTEKDPPKRPIDRILEPIRPLRKRGVDFFNDGHLHEARAEFEAALAIAEDLRDPYSIIDSKSHLAMALLHSDQDAKLARTHLDDCLALLATNNDDEQRADVLAQLAFAYEAQNDLEQSEAVQRQVVTLTRGLPDQRDLAGALIQLAWNVGRQGRTDEALQLNQEAYQLLTQLLHSRPNDDSNRDWFKYVYTVLGNLFFQRAKIHQRRADPNEAERALRTALEWQRRLPPNHETAKLLEEFARLKFFKEEWEEGKTILLEAASIYEERKLLPQFARSINMLGSVLAHHHDLAKAAECFARAAVAAKSGGAGAADELAAALRSLAHVASDGNDLPSARRIYQEAMAATDDAEFKAECLMTLSQLARGQGDEAERLRLVIEAYTTLASAPEPIGHAAAGHWFTLGWYLREAGRLEEALVQVRKARSRFDASGDAFGVAKAAFEIAGLLDNLGRKREARETCHRLYALIEDMPFFEIVAATELALARFFFYDDGDAQESLRLLERAIASARRHKLSILQDALLFEDELDVQRRKGTGPLLVLPEMLDTLGTQLQLCPSNKDGYLRMWVFSRSRKVATALRATLSPNIAVMTNDLRDFRYISKLLKPYREWSIYVPLNKYPPTIFRDTIPITNDMVMPPDGIAFIGVSKDAPPIVDPKQVPFEISAHLSLTSQALGGTLARYFFYNIDAKVHGADAGLIGTSLALPPQVHTLISSDTIEELKHERLYYIYYDRGAVDEERWLWYDLAGLRDHGAIPVYISQLPSSDDIAVVASVPLRLPAGENIIRDHDRAIRRVRTLLRRLIGADEAVATEHLADLTEFVADWGATTEPSAMTDLTLFLLRFQEGKKQRIHPAMVLTKKKEEELNA
jgi:tetratricopeptide (TPR) repeat protein